MDQNRYKARRKALNDTLLTICPNVYFQPPESVKMTYPAIRYKRSAIDQQSADNQPYLTHVRYELTVIDRNPDSDIVDAVMRLPFCSHNRSYTSENLNHDVFIIYA